MPAQHCPLAPGARVWSYLRVSGDEQADRGLPIAGQRRAHQEYADRHGLIIVRWFVDEAKSGGSTVGRDAFNDMVYLARQQPRAADGILLWDLKRFARNITDSQFYKADLRRRGWTGSPIAPLPGGPRAPRERPPRSAPGPRRRRCRSRLRSPQRPCSGEIPPPRRDYPFTAVFTRIDPAFPKS